MSTDFSTINFGGAAPSNATLKGLMKNALIAERQGGTSGDAHVARTIYLARRAMEVWPSACAIAAACVANDSTFTSATLDGLTDGSAA